MKTSEDGLRLIKSFEGCRLTAYLCPAGVWTIGWGHTGRDVTPGLRWTQEQVDSALVRDLDRFEQGVSAAVKVKLTQHQFDALVSFSYNNGVGSLQQSTLLRMLNGGDYYGASLQFARWNKASIGGQMTVLAGLTRRRAAEAQLFLTPDAAA